MSQHLPNSGLQKTLHVEAVGCCIVIEENNAIFHHFWLLQTQHVSPYHVTVLSAAKWWLKEAPDSFLGVTVATL
jgi:hypothetical protein